MKFFSESERELALALGDLVFVNPFTPERLVVENRILGRQVSEKSVWSRHSGLDGSRNEIARLRELADSLSETLVQRLQQRANPSDEERIWYEEVVIYHLFEKYRESMVTIMLNTPDAVHYPMYQEFEDDCQRFALRYYQPCRVFALFYQIHRAFYFIFDFIGGGSAAAGGLRAAVWQSVFTCDIRRYYRSLYKHMQQITTLIEGESGTGKELLARAISYSQYIEFEPRTARFVDPYTQCFLPVQLSAMPQNILESELFGHRRGAFTGAAHDREGYLASCPASGVVFLDEIGDINLEIQVKLLRLLQNRSFQKIGENHISQFKGRIIAATNRELLSMCDDGFFRQDLYYRLCADRLSTVPLRELIAGDQHELERFIFMASAKLLDGEDISSFAQFATGWIKDNLSLNYSWPGNVRELEQCIRNLIIRGHYRPSNLYQDPLDEALRSFDGPINELLKCYAQILLQRHGSISKASQAAQIDPRTLKNYLKSAD